MAANIKQVAAARKRATDRVKQAMVDARNKKINCKDCKKLNGRDGTQRKMDLPSKGGQWDTPDGKPPSSGNGKFTFDNPKTLPTDAPSNISTSSTESRISRNTPIATKKYDLCEVTGKDERHGRN